MGGQPLRAPAPAHAPAHESARDTVAVNGSATLTVLASDEVAQGETGMGLHDGEAAPVRWRFANAEYHERSHELMVAGEPVALEPKPLEVLLCLLRAEGELVTKQELFDTVWAGRVVTDGVLSQAIRRIREVLGDGDRTMLRTVHGYGYRLDVPIEIEGRDDLGTRLELQAGQTLPGLPDWVFEERLQTRPANELWRIRHVDSGDCRVLKLALDDRARRALKREVTLNKVLRKELGDNAALVPLIAWQFDTTPAWIQMPWYPQGSLADWLEAKGGPARLPMRRRLAIVAEAAEALAQAHALGVMHKDLKPGNLLVDENGPEPRLMLCDFGSGTVKSRERLAQTGVTVMGFTKTLHQDSSTSGTPAYMAPEVLKGGVFSEQSDVYAVGVLLYQLVIGELNEPLAPGWEEDVADPGLRAIIADACAGKPARRLASMQALATRLRAWQPQPAAAGVPATATTADGAKSPVAAEGAAARTGPAAKHPAGVSPPTPSDSESPRSAGAGRWALAALLLVALAAGVLWWPGEEAPDAGAIAVADGEGLGPRVAILAFELLGLDAQTQTVMGGLQDALVSDLASLAGIRLVQGQNLAALGLADAPARDIGRALNADQLIRGSVQQHGEQLRVNLQLVDADGGDTLWGQGIEGTRADLFSMQSDIARTLASALGTRLAMADSPTVDNAAYEAYLAALAMWKQGHEKDAEITAELERALELSPNFIDAHLLALLIAARGYWFSTTTRDESLRRISTHLQALERQDTPPVKLATARAVRRYYLEHDPRGGVEILAPFRRHLVRNTESALFYAYMLRRIGRTEESFAILDEVIDRDPSAVVPLQTKAELLAFLGRGGEAMAILQQIRERFGGDYTPEWKMAAIGYQLTGDVRFVQVGRQALPEEEREQKDYYAGLELARRDGDYATMRELTRAHSGEDMTNSGHGRMPFELGQALALRAGQAPRAQVLAQAELALDKLEQWRAASDSDARRGVMAVTLALLGRAEDAQALSRAVEEAVPLERDWLEGANRLLESSMVHALLGDEGAVLERLQALSNSPFSSMSLCTIPFAYESQAIWELPTAQSYIQAHCEESWQRNRAEMLPALDAMALAV